MCCKNCIVKSILGQYFQCKLNVSKKNNIHKKAALCVSYKEKERRFDSRRNRQRQREGLVIWSDILLTLETLLELYLAPTDMINEHFTYCMRYLYYIYTLLQIL